MKVLVVEDEKSLNNIIVKRLKVEKYSVDAAYDGVEALEYLQAAAYDLVLVDIMLPKLDGLSLVKKMRQDGNTTSVIFLTAKDTVDDRVKGLDIGGDDYLVKPFEFSELLARMRSIVRRQGQKATNQLLIADLSLDLKTHAVVRGGRDIRLTAKEFAILAYLLQNAGAVLSREQIQEHTWDFSYEGASNMIDVYINALRKKIDKDYPVKLLQTVRGVGYVIKA